jgi:antitoxin component YwqK of YwqJK toxin-antitoxin module
MAKKVLKNQLALTTRGLVLEGFWESYWKRNIPCWTRFYRNNELVGISKSYWPDGKIMRKEYRLKLR